MKVKIKYLITFFFISVNVFPWGSNVHKKLTEYSWKNSEKLKDRTFLFQLNLDKGMLQERLSDGNEEKNLDEWLQYGAEHEDDANGPIPDRSNFHFHNPLKYWWEAGLSDIHTGGSASSILCAQKKMVFNRYSFIKGV